MQKQPLGKWTTYCGEL